MPGLDRTRDRRDLSRMKNISFRAIAAALVSLCLGVALGAGIGSAGAQAAVPNWAAMEYSVVPVTGKTPDAVSLNQGETLNAMSRQGWRFTYVSTQTSGTYLFFERPARK